MTLLNRIREIESAATNLVDIHAEPTLTDLFAEDQITWHAGDVAVIAGGDAVGDLPGRGSYVYRGEDQTEPGTTEAADFLHLETPADLVESVAGATGTVTTEELATALNDAFIPADDADAIATAVRMGTGVPRTPMPAASTSTSTSVTAAPTILFVNFDENDARRMIVNNTAQEVTDAGIIAGTVLQLGTSETSRATVLRFETISGNQFVIVASEDGWDLGLAPASPIGSVPVSIVAETTTTTSTLGTEVTDITYVSVDNPMRIIVSGTEAEVAAAGLVNGVVLQTGSNAASRGTISDSQPVAGGNTRLIASDGTWDDPLVAPQRLLVVATPGQLSLSITEDGETEWVNSATGGGEADTVAANGVDTDAIQDDAVTAAKVADGVIPMAGTGANDFLAGNTPLLMLGTTSTTALAGDTAIPTVGTGADNFLAGNTPIADDLNLMGTTLQLRDGTTNIDTVDLSSLVGGIELTDLSATTAAASGTGSLAYVNTTGVFTYTPPVLPTATSLGVYTTMQADARFASINAVGGVSIIDFPTASSSFPFTISQHTVYETSGDLWLRVGADLVVNAAGDLVAPVQGDDWHELPGALPTEATAYPAGLQNSNVVVPVAGTTAGTFLEGNTPLLQLGTSATTALAGNTPLLMLGTTSTTALAGDTELLQLGTSATTALAGNTPLLQIGTTATTALAGNTELLQLGTTATTALAGNTAIPDGVPDAPEAGSVGPVIASNAFASSTATTVTVNNNEAGLDALGIIVGARIQVGPNATSVATIGSRDFTSTPGSAIVNAAPGTGSWDVLTGPLAVRIVMGGSDEAGNYVLTVAAGAEAEWTLDTSDGSGIEFTDLSVAAEPAASGNGALAYDDAGVFTYTPPVIPVAGTTAGTFLEGNTPLLQLGTTAATALAGNTELLQLGTTSTTALRGDTTIPTAGTGADNFLAANAAAPLASPALTGTPTAPTAAAATNTTQLATTEFVTRAVGAVDSGIELTDLSVTTATASGGGALVYDNTDGEFTYTPPVLPTATSLSVYTTTEADARFASINAVGGVSIIDFPTPSSSFPFTISQHTVYEEDGDLWLRVGADLTFAAASDIVAPTQGDDWHELPGSLPTSATAYPAGLQNSNVVVPVAGTTAGTFLEGNTPLLQIGTTATTALRGNTMASDIGGLQLGTTSTTALAGDTSLLQLGTTSTTALAGDTAIPAALTDLGITDGTAGQVLTTNGSATFTFADAASGGPEGIPDAPAATPGPALTTIAFNSFDGGSTRMIVTGGATGTPTVAELNAAGIVAGAVLQLGSAATSRGTVASFATGGGGTRVIVFNPSTLDAALNAPQDLSLVADVVAGEYVLNVPADGDPTWVTLTGGGIQFTDLSVGAEGTASGNGAIAYNNTNGVFTYTPPVIPVAGTTAGTFLEGDTTLLQLGTTATTALAGNTTAADIGGLQLGTSSTTALRGDTPLLQLGTTSTTALRGDTAIPVAGSGAGDFLAGNTPLLQLGTTATTALRGDTAIPTVGTGANNFLAGNTPLLQLGTTATTALAGNTTAADIGGLVLGTTATTALRGDTAIPVAGTTAGTFLEGNTPLLQLGTTAGTALEGNTVIPAGVPAAPEAGAATMTSVSAIGGFSATTPGLTGNFIFPFIIVGNTSRFATAQEIADAGIVPGAVVQIGSDVTNRATVDRIVDMSSNPNVGGHVVFSTGTTAADSWDTTGIIGTANAASTSVITGGSDEAGNYVLTVAEGTAATWTLDAGGGGGGGVPTAFADSIRVTTGARTVTLTPGYWRIIYRGGNAAMRIQSGFENIEGGTMTFPGNGDTGNIYVWNAGDGAGFDYIDTNGTITPHIWDAAFNGVGRGTSAGELFNAADLELIVSGNVEVRVVTSASGSTAVTSGALVATQIT